VNVLQLISSAGYYGAENVVVSLSKSLEGHGCRSVIGVFHNECQQNEELIRQARRRDLCVLPIPCRGRWDWQTIQAIRETLKTQSIDVLHTHGYKPDIYGYLAARKLGIPSIATCHLWTHDTIAVRVYEALDALFLRRFDTVVAVSDPIAKALRGSGIREGKIRVIDNGIDLSSFSQPRAAFKEETGTGQKLIVGTAGRLVPQKGLGYFLRAAREVLAEFADIGFVVVGGGPDREKLECMARELGIEKNIEFRGHCTDMGSVYASMDVFVLASLDEGMPMVVLEAMAAKKPVIATSVGAVPRLVLDKKTGLLVPPKDVPALKLAILRLLDDSSLRSQLGNAGAAVVKRFYSHETMAQSYLQLYEQIACELALVA